MQFLVRALFCAVLIAIASGFNVQHSLDGGASFAHAGELAGDAESQSWTLRRQPLDASQRFAFSSLIANNGFYTLKVSDEEGRVVTASVRAACLAAAGFRDALKLNVDDAGSPVSLQYGPAADAAGSCAGASPAAVAKQLGSARGDWGFAAEAPATVSNDFVIAPDIGSLRSLGEQLPGVKAPGAAGGDRKAAAPPQPEKTWLQRNWLFVLGAGMMVLNMMLKNDPPANGQAAPAGGQAAAGQARRR